MYRVAKAEGWNKFKIQRRVFWFFWTDEELGKTYTSYDLAYAAKLLLG